MCGIAGIYACRNPRSVDLHELDAMTAALAHRGPDETAAVLRRTAGRGSVAALGSTRLAIVDRARSSQPMSTADERYTLCLNGEIFNYEQLRGELEAEGVRFRTRGDTEVALQALACWGPARALRRFEGQFALALYDRVADRLVLARDRYGISPLFYRERAGDYAFASELQALQVARSFRSEALDPVSLVDLFVLWGFLPGTSPLAGVAQVDPGCWVELGPDSRGQRPYWRPEPAAGPGQHGANQAAEAVEQVGALLSAAVDRRLAPEVKLAVLLSGGLDSSSVSAMAARTQRIATFGIGFADEAYDETDAQWEMARHLGTEHHTITVAAPDLLKQMQRVVTYAGMPLTRMAPVATYLLAAELSLHDVRVVLTGEGADEMLLGYDIFKLTQARLAAAVGGCEPGCPGEADGLGGLSGPGSELALTELPAPERLPVTRLPGGTPDLSGSSDPAAICFSHLPRWESGRRILLYLRPEVRSQVADRPYPELVADAMPPGARIASPLRRAQVLELMTFLPTMLLGGQSDRMLMAHSIEGRYPFLDNALVDALLAMPDTLLSPLPREKALLREAMRGHLPEQLCNRPKQAYTAPLRGTLAMPEAVPLFDEFLSPAALDQVGLFDPARVGWALRRAQSPGGMSGEDARAVLFMLTTQMLHAGLIGSSR